jgi:hypothetical protein
VGPTSAQLTLEDLRREPAIYLVPEWETEEEAFEHLAEVSIEIFEEQLNGWYLCNLRLARRPRFECISSLVRLQFPFDGRRSL